MKKYLYTAGLLAAVALASCQKEETGIDFDADPSAVRISAHVGSSIFSRSNPIGDAATHKAFNSGDKISLSAEKQSAVYTFDGTAWTPETGTYLKWKKETMNFTAYYPTTKGIDAANFTLPNDQSSESSIAAADYMVAAAVSKNKADGAVELELERKTARIIVKIAAVYPNTQQGVYFPVIFTQASAYQDGAVTGQSMNIAPYAGQENPVSNGKDKGHGVGSTLTALVLPSKAYPNEEFIGMKDYAGHSFAVKGIPAHEAGKSYTYELTLGYDGPVISLVTIEDWITGTPIPGGKFFGEPFRDVNFVATLTAAPYNVPLTNGKIDPKDPVTLAALQAITDLDVSSKAISLEGIGGIEYMTNLRSLNCSYTGIADLNVSRNTALTKLDCSGNRLTALDVKANTALTELNCLNNQLTALDVKANTALTELYCSGNSIEELDVKTNTALTGLYCTSNRIEELDVTANTALTELYCDHNGLTALDVKANTALTKLYCNNNQLTALDLSQNTALTYIVCGTQKEDGWMTLTLTPSQKSGIWQALKDEERNARVDVTTP